MLAAKPRQVREELTKIGSEVHGMFFAEGVRILSLSVLMMCFAFPAWAGSRTATLLPAKTDIIVSLNPREFLRDTAIFDSCSAISINGDWRSKATRSSS